MADTNDLKVHSYVAKGIREGLTAEVADLFADDVPFFAMCEKVRVGSTHPEWQTDVLASSAKTAVVEGAAVSYTRPGMRTRTGNYTHIRLRNYDVTFTQMAVDVAGIKDSFAREVMKAMKALALDYESIFLNTGNSGAGTSSSGRTCKGIQKAIITCTAVGTGTGTSAKIQLSETNVNLLLQKIWSYGGNPRALFCGGHNKRVISTKFTAKTGFSWNINASTRMAIANVNKYEGSFGTVDIIPSREHMARRITIVTPEQLKVFVLRDIASYKGAATASSEKGWVEAELSLGWGNQKAHAKHTYLKHSGTIA